MPIFNNIEVRQLYHDDPKKFWVGCISGAHINLEYKYSFVEFEACKYSNSVMIEVIIISEDERGDPCWNEIRHTVWYGGNVEELSEKCVSLELRKFRFYEIWATITDL